MTYVPIVVSPPAPSHQTRELADLLGRVIVEYEKAHPSVSQAEVRAAAQIALQATRRGGSAAPGALMASLGLGVLMAGGFVFYLFSQGSIDLPGEGPFPIIAVLALVGVLLPLFAVLNRNKF